MVAPVRAVSIDCVVRRDVALVRMWQWVEVGEPAQGRQELVFLSSGAHRKT